MARDWAIDDAGEALGPRQEMSALALADAMPRLMVAARRSAATILHGLHGRRRAGPGEDFWQYRRFTSGEPANRVDWRRSARDDTLYVREPEWEVAHTVWIWIDRSPSMWFRSDLARASKVERAIVLGLAMADLLVAGGERVGLLGLRRPRANRHVVADFAEALRTRLGESDALPVEPIAARAEALLIGDFLAPAEETEAAIARLAARGARGHLILIADPVEEVFPFNGRTEFRDPETGERFLVGRAQEYRDAYAERLALHRERLRAATRKAGWSLALHRTDRPAEEALLALHARIGAGDALAGAA